MADNLKDYGSFIPGYDRDGAPPTTSRRSCWNYLCGSGIPVTGRRHSIARPDLAERRLHRGIVPGRTGLLIVISVCLDLVQKIDSHLVMRNYPGLVNRK